MTQATTLKATLESMDPNLSVEIVTIKTSGDRGEREQLGAFVHELQLALLDNRIDAALHCLKDLPTQQVPGLMLAAHMQREDYRDAFIGRVSGVADLPAGATVGTGSLRRTSQLAQVRGDLKFKPLVGNIDTRMRKLMEGEYDAIILATAGLDRMAWLSRWSESDYASLTVTSLGADEMLPAPGQAVLVIECRADDAPVISFCGQLNHVPSQQASIAERAFLRTFGSGCSVPVAALALVSGDQLTLTGLVAEPDGGRVFKGTADGAASEAASIGEGLAQELGRKGAFDVIQALTAVAR